jgi:hypothetical protein
MFLRSQRLARLKNTKKRDNRMRLCLDLAKKPFHLPRPFLLTQEQKNHGVNYHHYYSPAPSGGPMATKERMCDASESEARHT